jgi:RNA polymerase sigma factor (sigma-70 family)
MEAIENLVHSNLPFVTYVARRYKDRGVPLEDLIAEGTLGLMKAVRRFDPKNGARFTTYASFWIKKAIIEALLERPRVVHLPRYAREKGHAFPREVSLDAPVRIAETDATWGDRLPDTRAHGTLESIADREERRRLRSLVLDLSPREQAVLAERFGLHGGPVRTLTEIGTSLGLSKERVRQIESGALSRLKRRLRPPRRGGWS